MEISPAGRTLSHWLKSIPGRLASDTAALDAQVLLAHVVGKPRSWVLAHPEAKLSVEEQQRLEGALEHLQGGEPLPYILGHWEFFGLDFQITSDVLIPRPETELLVELAIAWLRRQPAARTAIDVGTGSGCIAVCLAVHIPDLHVLATDLSEPALKVARRNAEKHCVSDRIDFIQTDLLYPLLVERSTINFLPQSINLLTANLPYIPTDTLHSLAVYGKEPTRALDGGSDGLDLIRRLLIQAPAYLAPDGLLLLEIEQRQGAAVKKMAQLAFPQAQVSVFNDLMGYNRVIQIAKNE